MGLVTESKWALHHVRDAKDWLLPAHPALERLPCVLFPWAADEAWRLARPAHGLVSGKALEIPCPGTVSLREYHLSIGWLASDSKCLSRGTPVSKETVASD